MIRPTLNGLLLTTNGVLKLPRFVDSEPKQASLMPGIGCGVLFRTGDLVSLSVITGLAVHPNRSIWVKIPISWNKSD